MGEWVRDTMSKVLKSELVLSTTFILSAPQALGASAHHHTSL
jgi:hypothetical protein